MNRTLTGSIFAVALACASPAAAQAALVTGLGGPLDFGTDVLARDDDATSVSVDLTPAFPMGIDYFGTRYTSVFVNTNGNLSFGAALAGYTPEEFPHASRPIIAAWWADVDTRALIPGEPDRNLVYYAMTPGRLVATWIDVGYFREHVDRLDAFQIILTAAPGEPEGTFDVELRYNRCEWTTGDFTGGTMGLGGTAAQAGFDAGDLVNYVMLPGSRTAAVLDLCTTSNVDMTGVWQLHPRGSAVAATCGNGLRETGEACDDGNLTAHDGCDEDCAIDTPCYEVYPDGGISFPFDAELGFYDAGDANPFDANGNDARGAFMPGEAGTGPGDPPPPGIGPCGHDMDAEIPDLDAGMEDAELRDVGSTPFPDAGRFDAGPRTDAAVPNTLAITGSGCNCTAAGGGSRHGAWALLGLALLRRIRARARARAGTSRRP